MKIRHWPPPYFLVRSSCLLVGLLLVLSAARADSPYIVNVQHYSLGDGLPDRSVLTIGQDRQGFVWAGTLQNAYRFDGYAFKALAADRRSKAGLSTPVINSIRTDPAGNLWFFSLWSHQGSRIEILAPNGQKATPFETFFHRPLPFDLNAFMSTERRLNASARPTDPILIHDSKGAIWRYESRGAFKRIYQHSIPVKPHNLLVTSSGTVLLNFPVPASFATGQPQNELVELDTNGTIRRRHRLPAQLYPIWANPQGTVYLSHFSGRYEDRNPQPRLTAHRLDELLYQLSPTGKLTSIPILFQKNPFPNPARYRFVTDQTVYDSKHGLFWFLGKNVLFAWHPKHGIVFDLAASRFPVAGLIDFNQLFVDRTGAVWVGTQNGILLLTLEPNHFQRHFYTPDEETATPKFSTRGIVRAGQWLWVNSNGGRMLNLQTGQVQKLLSEEYGPAIQGRDGRIWTASKDSLVQIDPTASAVQKFALQPSGKYCWSLWQDEKHNFWLGSEEGLSYFDTRQKRHSSFTRYNQFRELSSQRVNGIFPDSTADGIWIAASSGLYLLDPAQGITARYSTQDAAPRQLPFDHITFVHPDRHQAGIYWLATRGGGLIRWERRTGRWQQFTREQGLSNDELYSVQEDRSGRLWLPSNYGLMRFHKQTHQVQLFLPKDGITHEEFNLKSYFQAGNSQFFLGGLNGITAFNPDEQLTEKPTIVPLMVTAYEQLNVQTGERIDYLPEFDQSHRIVVPPQNRSFSLAFSLLDYRYSRQFRLVYRIVGWQDYWTSQLQRELSINGLPPGNYQLQVRAQNPDGQWVSQTLTIPLIIQKPFYQQTWFLILVLLSLVGATIGFFQWRNYRLSQETKRLEEEVVRRTAQIEKDRALIEQQAADLQASATLKSRFFANVSHEFRTPLTLLLGPIAYLSQHLSDPVLMRLVTGMERNARQLLAMVSDLLDLSKLDADRLQLTQHPADLSCLINQLVATFTTQADYTGINLTAEGTTQPLWVQLDVPKVETVLKNLLANALKFTPAGGAVTVRLYQGEEWLRIEVSDAGSGIHPDDLPHIFERYYQSQQPDAPLWGGTGIGLALARDYCLLWGGELSVTSQLGEGSMFVFTHPHQPAPAPATASNRYFAESKPALIELDKETNPLVTKILLVEDNSDMVAYLETILAPHYRLHITRNGREAWEWLRLLPESDLPQLIVSDLMMPDMDGLTLVNHIRQQPTLRTIPVILLTARTSQDVKLQALRAGVADYLTKPFDQDELITRINNLLERSQEQVAWQQQLPPTPPTAPSVDDEWLLQIQQLILKNLTNSYFQVSSMAEAVNSSERQLYRRMKNLTGFSPNQFIQEIRLQTAREWLEEQRYTTVKEVCYAVGFQDAVYFARLFLQRFGRYPVSFLRTAETAYTDGAAQQTVSERLEER